MNLNYHEKETIRLRSSEPVSSLDLNKFLLDRGFKKEDDFYFVDRKDKADPWQAISAMTITLQDCGHLVYPELRQVTDKHVQWNELVVSYLLASLPQSLIADCVNECKAITDRFNLTIEYAGQEVTPSELQRELDDIAKRLSDEFDEPGSELLGILISQSYWTL